MTLTIIFAIIFIHWVADFVLQTHTQAINKSKSWYYLLEHTIFYSAIWFIAFAFWFQFTGEKSIILNGAKFAGITLFFHTLTDYFTSRLNAKLYRNGDTHNFFVSVGFDQVLHYVQLFLTYHYLCNYHQ